LCLEVGLPPGLVNVLPGGPEGGEALVQHPDVRMIHFTGGGATARRIIVAASSNLTPVATELGGKSANIVFADADLDTAAMITAYSGPLGQSGQSCACGSRIIVQHTVYDTFMDSFLRVVEAAKIGDPFDPSVVFGPLVSQSACDRVLGAINDAIKRKMVANYLTVTTSLPPYLRELTTTVRSRKPRRSGPWCPLCDSRTRTKRSAWPTTPTSDSSPISRRPT
jgi:aldehyde dehydrogenase (NAD+)